MRIATFNVNSLRARIDRVIALLERQAIDVLLIQETKAENGKFPVEPFEAAGYQIARHGLDQWNGVAIASRVGLTDVRTELPNCPDYGGVVEARAIGARCAGVEVWSLYIPNGREIDHPHYRYKLAWLEALRVMGAQLLADDPDDAIIFGGDFNVAPTDADVWDIAAFEHSTHVTPPEREAFFAVVDAGFVDLVQPIIPDTFTYWDYQKLRFPRKEGMRIDFLLGSPAVAREVVSAFVDRDERKGKGASDHAPVVVDLAREAEIVPVPDGGGPVEPVAAATPEGTETDGGGGALW